MSFSVFFSFSTGLTRTLFVPAGTIERAREHAEDVRSTLGIEWEEYNGHRRWRMPREFAVDNKVLCETAEGHNEWIRWMYGLVEKAPKEATPEAPEALTPEVAAEFWEALAHPINVPPARWTSTYYKARMEALYEALRGGDGEGMHFDAKALTTKQAACVVVLLSQWLDPDDARLEVPRGCDSLYSLTAGECEWCEKCGAVPYEDAVDCTKRRCPLVKELRGDR